MKVIFDLIASNSVGVTVAPGAVISLSITWFPTCGSYFVAWVKTLKVTAVGCSRVLDIELFEASVAFTLRVYSSSSTHRVVPVLYSLTFPVTMISLGAATSTLLARSTPLCVNPGKPKPLALPFVSLNIASTSLFELSVTAPILRFVSSVGVT